MYAVALRIELRLRGVRSLKGKRHVLKPILFDLQRNLGASVAEVGYQDVWQRSTVGVAFVTSSLPQLERWMDAVRRRLDEYDIDVLEIVPSHLEES